MLWFCGPFGPAKHRRPPARTQRPPATPRQPRLWQSYGGCPAAQEGWGGPRGGGGVWQARRPHGAAGPPNKIASPGLKAPGSLFQDASRPAAAPRRRVFRQRQKGSANSSPAPPHPGKGDSGREPVSQGHGTRNAVRKGQDAGSTPWAKPGPTLHGPGRNSPPRRGLRPQAARARWCATIAARAGPPPAQGRRPRRAAVRAGQL